MSTTWIIGVVLLVRLLGLGFAVIGASLENRHGR